MVAPCLHCLIMLWHWLSKDHARLRSAARLTANGHQTSRALSPDLLQPFTARPLAGHHPTHRCFTCESYVAESAFHKGDKLVSFIQGESVLAWPRAADALNKVKSFRPYGICMCHMHTTWRKMLVGFSTFCKPPP